MNGRRVTSGASYIATVVGRKSSAHGRVHIRPICSYASSDWARRYSFTRARSSGPRSNATSGRSIGPTAARSASTVGPRPDAIERTARHVPAIARDRRVQVQLCSHRPTVKKLDP